MTEDNTIPEIPNKCPQCGSEELVRILYGITEVSSELEQQIQEGKVILGGCSVFYDEDDAGNQVPLSPNAKCNQCGTEIF